MRKIPVISVLLFVVCIAVSHASPEPAGKWDGIIKTPGPELKITVTFTTDTNEKLTATLDIPQQDAKDLPLSNIDIQGETITFTLDGVPGNPKFEGTFSGDSNEITGTFIQGEEKMPFSLKKRDTEKAAISLQEKLDNLTTFIDTTITAWKIPGTAMAIVKDGEVIYSKGFGKRNIEEDLPVTPNTLFAIGSTSKAFTTMSIGMLVDEGLVEWDEKVRTYLPSFTLKDDYLTAHMNVRDLVTHRSGLPRHDFLWYGSPLTRKELFDRLRYLEPSEELRTRFQYNNLMYMTAGYLVGQVTGSTWEDVVRERIFEPLGMNGSNFSVTDSQKSDDFALPYDTDHGITKEIPFMNIDEIGPAGSINSSIDDMVKWLQFHLNKGKVNDRQLVSPTEMQSMYMAYTVMPNPLDQEETVLYGYGLGWMLYGHRGHLRYQHGGGIDGFTTSVSLLPKENIGMVVFANQGNSALPEAASLYAADLLLDLEFIDWHERRKPKEESPEDTEEKTAGTTKPAHDLKDYAGEYEHPGYGIITIQHDDGKLSFLFNKFDRPMEHVRYETFFVEVAEQKIAFFTNSDGELSHLSMPLETAVDDIVFDRHPTFREYVVKQAAMPIVIDGVLNEKAWKKAPVIEDFVIHDTGVKPVFPTQAQLLWDNENLYVSFVLTDRDIWATMAEHDEHLWNEEVVEVCLDPDGNGRNYLELQVNPLGTTLDLILSREYSKGGVADFDWTLEGFEAAVTIDGKINNEKGKDKKWICEIAIPFKSIAFSAPAMSFPPKDGDSWRVNLCRIENCRTRKKISEATAWVRTDSRGFHAPDKFGRIIFSEEGVQ